MTGKYRLMVLLLATLVLRAPSVAQQPDVRVHLLSLYRLTDATVEPSPGSSVALRFNSLRRDVRQAFRVRAGGSSVEFTGGPAPLLTVNGDFRIVSGRAPAQHVHGAVEFSARDRALWVVASLPMEDYVADVLEGETTGNMPTEALKALAVAIRSYTTRSRGRHQDEGYDFCDTTHCQYLRLEPEAEVVAAVRQTKNELLWDRGMPLAAYYHKDCGGQTEAAAVVWPDQNSVALVSHPDPYCVRTAPAWRSEVSRQDLDRALTAGGLHAPPGWNRIAVADRTPSGRAKTLRLSVGSSSGAPVSASSLRFAIGRTLGWQTLKSDWYEVSADGNDRFLFKGRGVGHGVGLCQIGAAEMARRGKTYREILAFYYPGAPIGRSAQAIPWNTIQSANFELRVVNPADSARVRAAASSALEWAMERSRLSLRKRPVIETYPTVPMFRDATGEPGWIAASTRNERVRLQPASVLGERLESVLRHEFLHMLVEANARQNTPLWFREGLVVDLEGNPAAADEIVMSGDEIDRAIETRQSPAEMRRAYAQAAALVRQLARQHGRATILEWLRAGLPDEIRSGVSRRKITH